MLIIRRYRKSDAQAVGVLIADTYRKFNLSELTTEQQKAMLGPFLYARSAEPSHQQAIADAIRAPSVWVAEADGAVVGVLRGGRVDELGRTVLQSLFVSGKHHRQGIGQALVKKFEQEYIARGVTVFKLLATLHAVPFYTALGHKLRFFRDGKAQFVTVGIISFDGI
jgi:GNAT superfamily N-acetyltransferase